MQLRNEIFPEKQRCRSIDRAVTYFRKAIGQKPKEVQSQKKYKVCVEIKCTVSTLGIFSPLRVCMLFQIAYTYLLHGAESFLRS